MNGTLTIEGDLTLLGKLAIQIDEWFPGAFAVEVEADAWGGWRIDTLASLLERLHPWQLLLVSYVSLAGGRRSDDEVRAKFAINGGLKGQTGPISKHIKSMKAAGKIPGDAVRLLTVHRTGINPTFVIPSELVPLVHSTLARPGIEKLLAEARASQGLDERD
jgi:hypothetical protein